MKTRLKGIKEIFDIHATLVMVGVSFERGSIAHLWGRDGETHYWSHKKDCFKLHKVVLYCSRPFFSKQE